MENKDNEQDGFITLATKVLEDLGIEDPLNEFMTSGGAGGYATGYSGVVDAGEGGGAVPANADRYATGDARIAQGSAMIQKRDKPAKKTPGKKTSKRGKKQANKVVKVNEDAKR